MSCAVCNGHPGCPCCTEEPHMIDCPDCGGTGYTFYNEEGNEISEEEYNANPSEYEKVPCDRCEGAGEIEYNANPSEYEKVPCDRCEGAGEIEYDYEPDYDNYNE